MTSDRDLVRRLGPTGNAFFGRFQALREVQRRSIDPVFGGQNIMLSSATASGKTEAVIGPLIARLRAGTPVRRAVTLLVVAPTRALVNDLHFRLEGPIAEVGWFCGRQTSDHHDKDRRPQVLITTPESFDSMLVRDAEWKQGVLKGHLLADVAAVFVDEAHQFEASPRGDQLIWLLARLRRLRKHAARARWSDSENVQVCAASATVAQPEELARKLLGASGRPIVVQASREIEMFNGDSPSGWVSLDTLSSPDDIYDNLLVVGGPHDLDTMVQLIWQAIENGAVTGSRKLLVFVPTRALCDSLSLALADFLKSRRRMYVGAHHGSLERAKREQAEQDFSRNRDAVLVATTTLEVGIDIGDVDVVAIIGAPPDTSSLLQRIGRSGRRNCCVRVVPIVRNFIEGRALCSMFDEACRGSLDTSPGVRRWSVFVQQAASHCAQAGKTGRRRADLLALAEDVWPEPGGPNTATRILEWLVENKELIQAGDRLYLGEKWSDRFERAGGDAHHNFGAGDRGIPVVDASTGETLTYVRQNLVGHRRVALGGKRYIAQRSPSEILVTATSAEGGETTFQYATRSASMGKNYAEHVRRGFGFQTTDAPLLSGPEGYLWFHFGGSEYEAVLVALLPSLCREPGLRGLALRGALSGEMLRALAGDDGRLSEKLEELVDDMAVPASLGRYHRDLPEQVRREVALHRIGPEGLRQWLISRRLSPGIEVQQAEHRLRLALAWTSMI